MQGSSSSPFRHRVRKARLSHSTPGKALLGKVEKVEAGRGCAPINPQPKVEGLGMSNHSDESVSTGSHNDRLYL
jgi:hypothetical protein